MKERHLHLCYREYDELLYFRTPSAEATRRIADYVDSAGIRKLYLYGASTTGKAVKEVVGEKFDKFITTENLEEHIPLDCDSIILTTSPIHYEAIKNTLNELSLGDIEVVTLFDPYQGPPLKPGENTDGNAQRIVLFTVHRAASMFIHHLTHIVTREAGLTYYSYYNGNFSGFERASVRQDTLGKERGCFGPFRSYVNIPDMETYDIIVHVRDPRDVLTSLFYSNAFSHEKSVAGFNPTDETRAKWISGGVDKFVLERMDTLKETYADYCRELVGRDNVTILKYEDMVNSFESWLERFIDVFPVGNKGDLKTRLCLDYGADLSVACEDPYRHKRQIRPGDHRRKLQRKTIEHLNGHFSEILTHLEYEL